MSPVRPTPLALAATVAALEARVAELERKLERREGYGAEQTERA